MLFAGRSGGVRAALVCGCGVALLVLPAQMLLGGVALALVLGTGAALVTLLAHRRLLHPLRRRVRELERRLATVVESGGLVVWTAPGDGRFEPVPEGWLRYTGQTPEQAAGRGWQQAVHPDDLAALGPLWDQNAASGEPYTQELRLWHAASGDWRWNLERGVFMRDEDGAGLWLGVLIDIDDRRRAEDALRASEQRYRELVHHSRDGIWRMEFEPPVPLDLPEEELIARYLRDGRVVECNEAFARCYGHDRPESMLGTTNAQMLPTEEPDNVAFLHELARSGFRLPHRETLEPGGDGSLQVMEATITGICRDGVLVGEWGIQRNVSAERAARAEAERQRRLLETVLDTAPVGLTVKDAERRYLYANRAVTARFGWQDEGFRGRRLDELVDSVQARRIDALDEEVFARGVSLRNVSESMYDAAEGETRALLIYKSPLPGDDRSVAGVVTCTIDVTELERARQDLQASERRWRRLFETAPVAMELYDADGEFVEGNAASYELFGEPSPGARQPNILDDAASLDPDCLHDLRRGAPWRWRGWYDFDHLDRLQVDRRGREGKRYLASVVAPLLADDGTVAGYIGTSHDETARRRSELALEESDQRYRRFLAQSHEGIWRVEFEPPVPLNLPLEEQVRRYRRDGRLAECNEALARQHGCTFPAELMDWLGGDLGNALEQHYAEAFLAGGCSLQDAAVVSRSRDGSRVDLRVNAVGEVVDGALVREWGTGQDVTAQVIAGRHRADERALLTAILESAPVGITVKDREGRYTYVNRWMCDVWGREPDELLGRRIGELGVSDEAETAERMDRLVLEGEAPGPFPNRMVRAADGAAIEVLVRKTAVHGADGEVIGVLSALQDVTALEQANRALERERAVLQAVLDTAPMSITVKDEQARYQYVNRRAREVSRWGDVEVVGRTAADVDDPLYARQVLELDLEVLRNGEARFNVEVGGADARSGALRVLRLNKSALRDPDGRITGIVSCTQDVSAQKAAERALEGQRGLFQAVLDALPIGIALRDRERRLRYMNRWWSERLGYGPEDIGRDSYGPGVSRDRRERLEALDRIVYERGEEVRDMEAPIYLAGGGAPRHGLVSKVPLVSEGGTVDGILTCTVDITERRLAEAALAESERRYRLLYDDNPSMFFTVDADGVLRQVNRFGAEQLGYRADELVGRSMVSLHDGEDREVMTQNLRACLAEPSRTHRWEVRRLRLDGSPLWVRETARAVTGVDGARMVLTVCEDISEARSLSDRLSWQATHDQLTGLLNRREFEHRLTLALESARGTGLSHTVAYLDLDQFKVINDTCGHIAGDELLRQLGVLFAGRVRRQDTLARLGGDEFGLLMLDCSLDAGARVCEGMRAALEDFRFAWEGKPFRVGMSVGLVELDGATANVADALSAADAACYAAKDRGRNGIHVHHRDDAEVERRRGEMRWVSRLESAMAERRLHLACQRIRALGGEERGEHYELLLRMRDENGAPVSPGEFLPAAERYGLAARLDRYVVAAAARWLGARPAHLERLYLCCINLSGLSLSSEGFAAFVRDTFGESGVPLSRICFEITETAAIANLAHATRFIDELRAEGCRFALDDFGSGLSSFAYLKQLPVEYLKIDGMFVRDMHDDAMDLAMVRSINEIGHVMGMRTIAECVESEPVLTRLRDIGVDYAQGYHLGRPGPLDDLA